MAHYSVAIFTKPKGKTVQELLEPFYEDKYDWYTIGGRFKEYLKLKEGRSHCSSARVSEVDFDSSEDYESALRFWELWIEKQEPKNREEEIMLEGFKFNEKYYTDTFKTKEGFAKALTEFSTYAVITSDGKWHEHDEEDEEGVIIWSGEYKERFIDTAIGCEKITIVDCHC